MDAHAVPADRLAVSVLAAALGELRVVELDWLLIGQDRLDRCVGTVAPLIRRRLRFA
ncbi:hypothetical protein [Candidatus Poriferisodalis sp.]|uniref:hypothetical protein n=1 Tax=Candidatus Poriferisodalis sp. TaxID=3101277 RepID=UPI003B01CB05